MKKGFIRRLFVVFLSIPLISCSNVNSNINTNDNQNNNQSSNEVNVVHVTGVSLNVNALSLALRETYQLIPTITPTNATNKKVLYGCNNNIVASVDSNGKITALNEGNAKITATTEDGNFTAVCSLEVYTAKIPVTGLSLDKTSITLNEGQEEQLTATIIPNNASNPRVSWSSSNENVAVVSTKGLVTAKKEGTAIITAKSKDETNKAGGYTAECSVTVKKVENEENVNPEQDPTSTPNTEPDPIPAKEVRMQDTPILHCWNWSMTTIINKLDDIKAAGFKTIQLSPMQPQKDYYSNNGNNESWGNGWWKLYQPLGFVVATKDHSLGTKAELTTLCAKAKSMGIDVIVDVVSNHLAGGSAKELNGGIKQYEPDIYNKKLIHLNDPCQDWEDPKQLLTRPLGGYPDLQTENTEVQTRVISLLKEYIDCGVNGFRFDAAKHIETPDDGTYASNYWPNILKGASDYAKSKNLDEPYYYGETLNTIGNGRQYTSYTKYMSITDTRQGSSILGAVTSSSPSSITDRYISGISPDQLVLWAESHDTYADKSTSNISIENIHKAYVIQTSRKDASTLYFARPNSGTKLGDVGREDYKNSEIKAINDFHNTFIGQSEDVSINNGCFINIRGKLGAAIVGINNTSSNVSLNVSNLENGKYKDLVTSKEYTVSSNKVTVTLTNNTCILVNTEKRVSTTPEIELGDYKEVYANTQSITVNAKNATKVTYSINEGTAKELSGNSIALDSNVPNGKVVLKIIASNDTGSVSKTINLVKSTTLVNKSIVILDMDKTYTYYVWSWSTGSDGVWSNFEFEGDIAGADLGNFRNFIIVKFPNGTSTPDWNKKITQTGDLSLSKKVWQFSELGL